MEFLEKIENLINMLLTKIGELLYRAIPAPMKRIIENFDTVKTKTIAFIKNLPAFLKELLTKGLTKLKSEATTFNYKQAINETYKKAMSQYKEKSPQGISDAKTFFLTPFLLIEQWLKGLSTVQSLMILTFSVASIFSVIGIYKTAQDLIPNHRAARAPASADRESTYDRPSYYKKHLKHLELVNLRLPVYFAEVNELKSVDIDFVATLSNRGSRIFLEKHEFQLRDHLILQIEPSVAFFPLQEEGKEIIRKKIWNEINEFLKTYEVEGEVVELKITYTLAN